MARWLRVVRGMIGTGLAFMVGGGVLATMFGAAMWVSGDITVLDMIATVARFAIVAFPIGVVFSGILALVARGLPLEKLPVSRVAGIGAGVGLLYFALIARNGLGVWSLDALLANLAVLTLMGGGSATAILLLARRARPALDVHDPAPAVTEGSRALAAAWRPVTERVGARETERA